MKPDLHLVPLSEAHATGGSTWEPEKKVAFANDLSVAHHLVAVKAHDRLKLYIDGKHAADSTKFNPARFNLDTTGPLKIGFGQHDYFNGKMKDLRIYDRELSPREIESVRSAAK